MTAEDILAEAARRIEMPGRWWHKGEKSGAGQAECMWLACVHQLTEETDYLLYGIEAPVRRAILKEIGAEDNGFRLEAICAIYAWNDAPGRTLEEVATALRNGKRWL